MPLQPGTTLGGYQILRAIGAGGMGEVYLARDARLGREVAVKVLPEEVARDSDRLARFEREARLLASLNHPNIATLFGFETARPEAGATLAPGVRAPETAPVHLLVMELVAGDTLADRIARGPLRPEEALPIFLQIAEGLEAAHERGVVHRDLKPANVKVSPQGTVKILDFGLAKALVDEAASSSASFSHSPTLTLAATIRGEILGTAAYMAPEQARGQPVDRRADVWAFGACLFEALTAKRVFAGETVTDTLALVLQGTPDWDALPPRTPRPLVDLLRRCLEKSTKERLRDIGEARVTIGRLLADGWEREPVAAPQAASLSAVRGWRAIALAAALLAGGAALGWVAASRRPRDAPTDERPATRFTMSAPGGEAFTDITDVAISADGRHVVYRLGHDASHGVNDSQRTLYLRRLDAFDGDAEQIAGTEGAQYPFFSPDGEWVGFFLGPGGQRTLSKVHLERGTVVAITREPHPGYRASWSPTGEILLGNQRGLPSRVAADGSIAPLELDEPSGAAAVSYLHPHWLPDGRRALFTRLGAADEEPEIALIDLETESQKTILTGGGDARYVGATAEAAGNRGFLLYGYHGELRAVRFDLERGEAIGDPLPVVPQVRMDAFAGTFFAVSADGALVYLPGESDAARGTALLWIDRHGEPLEEIAMGSFAYPTLSRDGRRIAVVRYGEQAGLQVIDADAAPVRLAGGELRPEYPVWAPDGAAVYFGTGIPGAPVVHRVLADGALRRPEPIFTAEELLGGQHPGSISADGGELLIAQINSRPPQDMNIVAGSVEGGGALRDLVATEFDEHEPELSPRGGVLAYVSDRDGENRVYLTTYPEQSRHLPVTAGASFMPRWSSDGAELFFVEGGHLWSASVEVEPELRIRDRTRLFRMGHVDLTRGYDVAPDGRFLAVRAVGEAAEDRDVRGGRLHVVLGLLGELENAGR
jgi:serine/threonine-protein kinase